MDWKSIGLRPNGIRSFRLKPTESAPLEVGFQNKILVPIRIKSLVLSGLLLGEAYRRMQLNDYGLEVHRFKAEWNSVVSAKAD